MKKHIDLAVIIPCYNVETYIDDCLNSILNQDVLPKEIILVDDGSSDNTTDQIAPYIEKYSFIHYHRQVNAGVAEARNYGLKLATSTYIQFIDADDAVDCNFYKIIDDIIENSDIDLLYFESCSFKKFLPMSISIVNVEPMVLLENGVQLVEYLLEHNKYTGVCWRYIFKKINVVTLFSGKYHEDHLFTLKLMLSAKNTCYLPLPLYQYRIRQNSLSHGYKNNEYVNSFYEVLKSCLLVLGQSTLKKEIKWKYAIMMITFYLRSVNKNGEMTGEQFKLIYGYYELLYRKKILKKRKLLNNFFFINKLSKRVNYSFASKIKLLRFAYTDKYPNFVYQFNDEIYDLIKNYT